MSDISQLQINGVTYDIADATARDNYLPLSGGAMTGPFLNTGTTAELVLQNSNIERDTPPSSAQFLDRIALCDINGEVIGYLRTPFQADGREGVQLETKRVVNGSNIYHGVQLYIDASGNRTVDLSDAAAWRDGLGLGALSLKDSLAASDIPGLAASKITSGQLALARGGTGTDNSTGRAVNTVFAAPSGAAGAASWRKLEAADIPTLAIGTKTNGTLALNRGGTGMTATDTETTITTVITADSAATISGVGFRQWGNVCQLAITFTPKSAVTVNNTITVGTTKSGFRPSNSAFIGSARWSGTINTSGVITLCNVSNASVSGAQTICATWVK